MKLAGLSLLLSGWILVLFALVLLRAPAERAAFVVAALAVEGLGLALELRAHREDAGERL
jgi:hypothetical protein